MNFISLKGLYLYFFLKIKLLFLIYNKKKIFLFHKGQKIPIPTSKILNTHIEHNIHSFYKT